MALMKAVYDLYQDNIINTQEYAIACLTPGPVELVYEQEQVTNNVVEQEASALLPKKELAAENANKRVKKKSDGGAECSQDEGQQLVQKQDVLNLCAERLLLADDGRSQYW
ncbi:unnamed protein product [Cuscuta campestris]|uniref:Uncharacterized protein n=1 Tax=Cuscuta campestris TaxID=132261 RepID=A0A484NKF8_9ASTE|nr:unnamed protein product [Cuscuta campestris]